MVSSSRFRVVIFSGADPHCILRLVQRIHREVPETHVCGVLSERRPAKTLSKRVAGFLRNLRDSEFPPYALSKIKDGVFQHAGRVAETLLQFLHGGGPFPRGERNALQALESMDCTFRLTSDYHSAESLAFVQNLQPDLGIVYGTRILKPGLFSIPRLGSINIHKRKVPDYRGGGPVGLWEMLDGQPEIGVTVHEVTEKLDAGAVVNEAIIPIDPFDNLTSLALKAHVIGNDLLIRSVADFANSTVKRRAQQGTGRMFKLPAAQRLHACEKQLTSARSAYRPTASRSNAKLIAKTLIGMPAAAVRNWRRRLRGAFPVNILFHHLVTDRPHRLGISTAHFLEHVRFLQRYYDVVSMQEAIRMLEANSVRRPTVVLTFDDGYGENFINLRAVVEETGVPVTMFVSSDHIQRGLEFHHDVEHDERGFLPLTWPQLKQMKLDGFEVGSHTRTHFDCGSQDLAALGKEIEGSRKDLEAQLNDTIQLFSFPFGLPENISPEAAGIASRCYAHVFSAFGGDNPSPAPGALQHLRRWPHPNRLWELELQLQGVLERAADGYSFRASQTSGDANADVNESLFSSHASS